MTDVKKVTRKLYAIMQLKTSRNHLTVMFGQPLDETEYSIILLKGVLYDTEEQALEIVNEENYIFAMVQPIYMTFTNVQWEEYDSNKPPINIRR